MNLENNKNLILYWLCPISWDRGLVEIAFEWSQGPGNACQNLMDKFGEAQ